jgi:hypothetical protein
MNKITVFILTFLLTNCQVELNENLIIGFLQGMKVFNDIEHTNQCAFKDIRGFYDNINATIENFKAEFSEKLLYEAGQSFGKMMADLENYSGYCEELAKKAYTVCVNARDEAFKNHWGKVMAEEMTGMKAPLWLKKAQDYLEKGEYFKAGKKFGKIIYGYTFESVK